MTAFLESTFVTTNVLLLTKTCNAPLSLSSLLKFSFRYLLYLLHLSSPQSTRPYMPGSVTNPIIEMETVAPKESEMRPSAGSKGSKGAGNKQDSMRPVSGGLGVPSSEMGFNLRTLTVGDQVRTSSNLQEEPRRPAGLHGPSSGPG
jgi:hypothetical protein